MLGISVILSYAVFVYLCFCEFVFVYLCICICVYVYFTVQNILFDVLGPLAFQKYNTCWVFPALHHRLYLCICEFVFVFVDQGNCVGTRERGLVWRRSVNQRCLDCRSTLFHQYGFLYFPLYLYF